MLTESLADTTPTHSPKALCHDPSANKWLLFSEPLKIIQADSVNEVRERLNEVEQLTLTKELWAVGWLTYEASPAFDHALHSHPCQDIPPLWFALYNAPEILAKLPAAETPHEPLEWTPSVSESDYLNAAYRVRELISLGDTYQVNLSFRMQSKAPNDPYQLFYSMHQTQAGAYSCYIDSGRFIICSASPELFFERQGDTIRCRPMKGTAARGSTASLDHEAKNKLSECPKNRAENVMIVDMVRNDLSLIAKPGSVKTPKLFSVEGYPNILQMTSEVVAQTDYSNAEVISALFPSASITGAPKPRTTKIISELETTPRGLYTGSVGVITPSERSWFNVAIRTAVVDRLKGTTEYGVGSGIVWDSEAGNEYRECLMKASAISRQHAYFELFETMLWTPQAGVTLLDRHLKRISESAKYFGWPIETDNLKQKIDQTLKSLPTTDQPRRLRLTLNRYGEASCSAAPLIPLPSPYRVALAKLPIDSSDHRLYHKTSDRAPYQNAIPTNPEANDVILWNERGEITETRIANIIVEIKGERLTPPIHTGLLAGCERDELLAKGWVKERIILTSELASASNIYLINSLRGIWPAELI